jgi:hypothetical protein
MGNQSDYVNSVDSGYIIGIRRRLHEIPELEFDLPQTLNLVRNELSSLGIPFTEKYGRSSIVADINPGKQGFTIGIRADMDALPVNETNDIPYKSQIPGLALHMAKIMECGALASEPMTASDAIIGEIEKDFFTLEPANPARRCTVSRVAAHTMYEQSNPYFIYEPDGVGDLRSSRYEQLNERTVKVSKSLFKPAEKYTLKIEGAMPAGYRTICTAKINDPDTISHLDEIFERVHSFVRTNLKDINPKDYQINLRRTGDPLPGIIAGKKATHSLGIIIDVVGKTQETANAVCALTRARLLHTDYPGRKSSAGNLAFPFSPSDIPVGQVYVFGIYHLVETDDPCETSKMDVVRVGD